MPDIPVGTQIFDLVFHPSSSIVFTGLLTGHIKAFGYDEQGNHEAKFSVRPSKRSCRALTMSEDGSKLWAAGKAKTLHTIDVATGQVVNARLNVHDAPINRLKRLTLNLLSSGDDDGVIKLWDPRKPDVIRSYTHHFDFISDFLYLPDNKQLVSTSGDGTLSVIDIRGKKTEPLAHSEDQEDELLSIVPIKGGQKFVVGTQLGILSVFNTRNGWETVWTAYQGKHTTHLPALQLTVHRISHPHSIDTLCTLPSSYRSSHSTILTGSSDGILRAVQLFPTKLLGVVADHGEFPIERIAVDREGEGRWIGSAGHEEILKLTDLKEVFEDEDEDEDGDGEKPGSDNDNDSDEEQAGASVAVLDKTETPEAMEDEIEAQDVDSSNDDAEPERKERKRKKDKDPLQAAKRKKGRNELDAERSFFSDL